MKKILLSAVICLGLFSSKAQETSPGLYNAAIGFKVAGFNAVTYKKFFKPNLAFDLYGGMRWFNAPAVGVLLEFHKYNMFGLEDMAMYYGGGIHGGSYITGAGAFVGLDGVFGFEYNFTELIDFPVSAAVDITAGADFITFGIPVSSNLSIRYIFDNK